MSALNDLQFQHLTDQVEGVAAQKVTAAAAGSVTVKASAGVVFGVRVASAVTGGAALLDGATERWQVGAGDTDVPLAPIKCETSIILDFAAAGDAWIIYR